MNKKSIVIDFDKTIGYFDEILFIFKILYSNEYKSIRKNKHISHSKIENILLKFIKCLRPNILKIINLILSFRDNNTISKFILYTNNKNNYIISKVISVLQQKLEYKNQIFDDIIVSNKEKNVDELKHILESKREQLCFIDNRKHINMINENIFYIHCKSYIFEYKYEKIYNYIEPYLNIGKTYFKTLYEKEYEDKYYKNNTKRSKERKISLTAHKIISNDILNHILFFIHNF